MKHINYTIHTSTSNKTPYTNMHKQKLHYFTYKRPINIKMQLNEATHKPTS